MASSLLWSSLTEKQLEELQDVQSTESCKGMIAKFLSISTDANETETGSETESKSAASALAVSRSHVLLDFAFYNLEFCKSNGYGAKKTSAFMSIMQEVLRADTSVNLRQVKDSFENFQQLLLKHAIQRPPWSVAIFTREEVDKIVKYTTDSYYRHFKLYQFTLTQRPVLAMTQCDLGGVEEMKIPRPLCEALEEEEEPRELNEDEENLVNLEVQRRIAAAKAAFEEQEVREVEERKVAEAKAAARAAEAEENEEDY